ncbi:MAG TPA: alkaline phosphatase family protein [Thermomicrobiales bacterium]|nr:alkaline phosphatase family protein [Thermomicrobiales bacterium]
MIQALCGAACVADARLLPRLSRSILDPAAIDSARVVVLVILDGYGSRVASGGARLAASARGALLTRGRLTSVFPSTTAAALTSIQTGASPGQHGIAGYTLYLPAARRVVNMVQFTAVDGSTLPERAVEPTRLLPVPTIYERLAALGVDSVVVSHLEYARSPLTILHSGETPYRGHRTAAEFAWMLNNEARRPGRRFIFGYWAGIDMLAHAYGPASPEVKLEVRLIEEALAQGLLSPLERGSDDVVVIVTADHGLAATPKTAAESLPQLAKRAGKLTRSPSGERRAVGLVTTSAAQRSRWAQEIGERGAVIALGDAASAGLFGPGPLHDELEDRVGDTLLLARGPHSFPFRPARDDETHALGAHGSLTSDEMLVPLLAWRFGR